MGRSGNLLAGICGIFARGSRFSDLNYPWIVPFVDVFLFFFLISSETLI